METFLTARTCQGQELTEWDADTQTVSNDFVVTSQCEEQTSENDWQAD